MLINRNKKNCSGFTPHIFWCKSSKERVYPAPLSSKSGAGFTIIELLVSVSIIVVISTLVIFNIKGLNQKTTLEFEAERLSSILRRAHINTLIGLTDGGTRPAGGFGVHIDIGQCAAGSCLYILFADDGNHQYDGDPPDSIIQELGMLDNNISVSLVQPANPLDIVFAPPSGEVYINGLTTGDSATTTLLFINSSYTKELIIDQHTGRINIR